MNDFHLLWSETSDKPGMLHPEQLRALYAFPDTSWVRGSMVSSIDGSATGPDGLSASVSSPPDRAVLSLMRGLADVILVAAGTTRSEGYRRTTAKASFQEHREAKGQQAAPTIAVVTSSGEIDDRLLRPGTPEEVGDLIVLTTQRLPEIERARLSEALGSSNLITCGTERVDPAKAVAALFDRGLSRVVCEGGPSWLAALAGAGQLNELCLTTSPLLVAGDGSRVLTGPAIPDGSMRLGHIVMSGDTVFTRWVR